MNNVKDNLFVLIQYYDKYVKDHLNKKYGGYFFEIMQDYLNEKIKPDDMYLMNNKKSHHPSKWSTLADSMNHFDNKYFIPHVVLCYYNHLAIQTIDDIKRRIKGGRSTVQDYLRFFISEFRIKFKQTNMITCSDNDKKINQLSYKQFHLRRKSSLMSSLSCLTGSDRNEKVPQVFQRRLRSIRSIVNALTPFNNTPSPLVKPHIGIDSLYQDEVNKRKNSTFIYVGLPKFPRNGSEIKNIKVIKGSYGVNTYILQSKNKNKPNMKDDEENEDNSQLQKIFNPFDSKDIQNEFNIKKRQSLFLKSMMKNQMGAEAGSKPVKFENDLGHNLHNLTYYHSPVKIKENDSREKMIYSKSWKHFKQDSSNPRVKCASERREIRHCHMNSGIELDEFEQTIGNKSRYILGKKDFYFI